MAVIDPERGVVIGYSILYYGNSTRRMQINEVFKILDGRIRMVDNIGLMEKGLPRPASRSRELFGLVSNALSCMRVKDATVEQPSGSSTRCQLPTTAFLGTDGRDTRV